jgi:hypothetical protein
MNNGGQISAGGLESAETGGEAVVATSGVRDGDTEAQPAPAAVSPMRSLRRRATWRFFVQKRDVQS